MTNNANKNNEIITAFFVSEKKKICFAKFNFEKEKKTTKLNNGYLSRDRTNIMHFFPIKKHVLFIKNF